MKENLARKTLVEKVRESDAANDSTFELPLELPPLELTPTEAEIASLEQDLAALPNEHDLPEGFPALTTADLVEVVADDAFVKPLTPPRLTRADFPGQGSAVMPELVFKKPAPVERRGFFKRFISKFF